MIPFRIEDIDAALIELAEPVFYAVPLRPAKAKRSMSLKLPTGRARRAVTVPGGAALRQALAKGGVTVDAKSIRHKLDAVVRRTPEAVVKITGAARGMRQVKRVLSYISREGEIELEGPDGDRFSGSGELVDVMDLFEHQGYPIGEDGSVRDTLNLVFSRPRGTDVVALKRAVREFAAAEFSNHVYAMALHTWETDPSPKPSRDPHVHLIVKVRSHDGVRLDPRKADLHRWRELYAHALRANGLESVATRRAARMQRQPGERGALRQLKVRGDQPTRLVRREDYRARRDGAIKSDAWVAQRYREVAGVLRESPDPKDLRLAMGLLERFGLGRDAGRVAADGVSSVERKGDPPVVGQDKAPAREDLSRKRGGDPER